MFRLTLSLLLSVASCSPSWALQATPLEEQIRAADEVLFERGFNRCELDKLQPIIDSELVFYHDQSGVSYGSEQFFTVTEKNICGNQDYKPIRKPIAGSFSIFPLFDNGKLYGALHQGEHAFYIRRPNKPLFKTSEAKFTHLWLLQDGQWVLKQVYSFDHKSPEDVE